MSDAIAKISPIFSSTMTIAEIVVFVASKAYQENSEAVAKGAIGELSSVPGIESYVDLFVTVLKSHLIYKVRSYNGFQYEVELEGGVKKAVWINGWLQHAQICGSH